MGNPQRESDGNEGEGGRVRSAKALAPGPIWAWRVFLRSLAFAHYGLSAATLGVLVIPVLRVFGRLRGWSDDVLDVASQRVIHRTTDNHLRFSEWIDCVRIVGVGTERLAERPQLIIANHPSLDDTPILTRFLPPADFIVSGEWSGNPFLRGAIRGGGYLIAESGALAVRKAIARLRAGRTVVVYPEGSRSLPGGLRPFQRGAALIALRSGLDVVPVVIRVTPRTLMKGQSVVDLSEEGSVWRVEVGEPIRPKDYVLPGETNAESARRLTAVFQEYFEKRWDRGSC
jgi:1-acyl-sn-glycerol-3-phosphate acyltransferase